jgi:acyl carrier protein
MTNLERDLREFIGDNYFLGDKAMAMPGRESLTTSGVIDSLGVAELILFLEEHYHIRVSEDEMLPEYLDSIDNIVSYLQEKLQVQAA